MIRKSTLKKFCGYEYPEPFPLGGFLYATNGYIVIRVPAPRLWSTQPVLSPPAEKIKKLNLDCGGKFRPLPKRGHYRPSTRREAFAGIYIQTKYYDLIESLPSVRFKIVRHNGYHMVIFKFDGGVGSVMEIL